MFWITVKIGDQVYKAVLKTGAPISIVARRLLKQARIRKTKIVDIRSGWSKHPFPGVGQSDPVSGRGKSRSAPQSTGHRRLLTLSSAQIFCAVTPR